MSATLLHALSALLAVSILAMGCNSKKTEENSAPETDKAGLFKEGKGVVLSDETKKLFGVEVTEVTEKAMQRHLHKTAQVYRAGRENGFSSAMVLLSAEEAKQLKIGQRVGLKAGNAPERSGTLARLDEQSLAALGHVEGLVDFNAVPEGYGVGAFVTATFTCGEAKTVFVVPESAMLTTADGSYVYALNGSHLLRTRVKTAAVSEGFVEIDEGLYAGDSVAAQGVESLWMVELSALKGGTPCCPVPKRNADK
ncbi:MAG: hypothetical protein QOF48_1259 [Verrucomicrobiota bacterium]|jgi:multidrug efflux pump subunit AcrA (membrane-fusion protein)